MAARCKSRVEVLGARTETSQVFAGSDGKYVLETYAVPQRVRKGGEWADIDPSLHKGADGALRPAATLADVTFSGGGTGPMVTVIKDGKRFELSWPSVLPVPAVAGSTATYAEVFSGVDLTVEATRTGYRQTLVVKNAAAATNPALSAIRYRVSGDLHVVKDKDGALQLADAEGKVSPMQSHASSMWDSSFDPAREGQVAAGLEGRAQGKASDAHGAGPGARVAPVAVTVSGEDMLVVPDQELMSSPTYPVFIDPPFDQWYQTFAYANTINSNWDVRDEAWVGRNPFDGTLYRSFWRFDIAGLAGKQITSVVMTNKLDHSAACAGNTAYLYRASGIASAPRTGWSPGLAGPFTSAWGDSNEAGGCGSDRGDDPMTFGSTGSWVNDLQGAANGSWSTYTVGVCMCSDTGGSNESGTYQWMRFFVANTMLSVFYNTYPGTPANLTTSNVACGGAVGTTSPNLKAQYVDVDGSDTLTGYFEWKELPSGAVNSVTGPAKPANNYGDITLNLGAAAEGKTYSWRVQTADGIAPSRSAWSGWCDFKVNASAPPVPGVSSTAYPEGPTANGGPGVAGSFTFTNGGVTGQDVVRYVYGWTDPPSTEVTVGVGQSYTVTLTPPRHGFNTLHVFSKDEALTPGPIKHYQFLVGGPSAALAYWPLDDIAGHNLTDQVSGNPLTTSGAVSWVPNARFFSSNAFHIEPAGPSEAAGTVSTFDTSGSFSVAARVRLSSTSCSGNRTAVSVDADTVAGNNHVSGFLLSFDCATFKWRMRLPDKNIAQPVMTEASAAASAVGQWTYLVGVWDEAEQKLRLYVNGALGQERIPAAAWLTSRGTGWKATGKVTIGRDRWNDANGGGFQGEVADVRLWNRVVVGDDIWGTATLPGLLAPTEVGTWTFADTTGCFCTDAGDGSYWGRRMYVNGTASFVDNGGPAGNGSLSVSGGSYAQTNVPVLRTDQSFTVTSYAKPTATGATDQTVMRQGNGGASAFKLLYEGGTGKWAFTVSTPDGSGGYSWANARSNAVAVANTWVKLTGVFDTGTGETRLYVNDVLQTTKGAGGIGWPTTGALILGHNTTNSPFTGEIDEVKAFAGSIPLDTGGAISGYVGTASPASGTPVIGAPVQICLSGGGHCLYLARTDSAGWFRAVAVPAGTYDITAFPTGSQTVAPVVATGVVVTTSQTTQRDLVFGTAAAPVPSAMGTVLEAGVPVAGATVTLLRSDSSDGVFTAVTGDLVTPGNRTNPVTTVANGQFGWDMVAGYYKVRAAKTGCPTVDSPVLTIPTRPSSLQLTLVCSTNHAPTVTTAPVSLEGNTTGGFTGTITGVTTADADGDTVTLTSNAPNPVPLGVTTVTWTAKDPSNATGTATQAVTVVDTTKPAITCPAPVSGTSTNPALGTPSASDIVDATLTIANNKPGTFPVGTTTVTWTATDDSSNAGTCTQQVTVTAQTGYTFTGFWNNSVNVGTNTTCAVGTDFECHVVVEWQLKDSSGTFITSLAAITSVAWDVQNPGDYITAVTYNTTTNKFSVTAVSARGVAGPSGTVHLTVTFADGTSRVLNVVTTGGGCTDC
jgi:hypothetical protein